MNNLQFLTFLLADEEYGIDILRVQEIKGHSAITPIPNAPVHIRGVMNLRGSVVPIVDLRSRFGMPVAEITRFTVFVIVNLGRRAVGLLVDAVSDVLDVPGENMQPTPELGAVDTSFMCGMARNGDRLILLLDIDRLMETT
jgi:purine-binding chemotaxis protein CheW